MSVAAVLAPVFVQVALTFFLLFWTGRRRFEAIRKREVAIRDIALAEPNWPPRVMQVSNAFHNQFQTPVLFYALVALALVTRQADLVFVAMSWAFVLARVGHAAVYGTTNHVPTRFRVFLGGTLMLMVMWIVFAVRILLGGASS